MGKFCVTVPFVATLIVVVEAETEDEALSAEFNVRVYDDQHGGLAVEAADGLRARLFASWPDSAQWPRAEAEEVKP